MTPSSLSSAPLAPVAPVTADVRAALRRVERVAYWLDDAFEIPLLRKRIGLDGVLGLVPGVGDAAGWLASLYIVVEAARLGVGVGVLLRMGTNVAVDLLVGAIPLIGDVADIAVKANRRNAALLFDHFGVAPHDEPGLAEDAGQGMLFRPATSHPVARAAAVLGIVAVLVAVAIGISYAVAAWWAMR